MPKGWKGRPTSSLLLCGALRAALVVLVVWFAACAPSLAVAQTSYDDENTAEGWAWSKIENGEWADFNDRCNPREPPVDIEVQDGRWLDDCRKLKSSFITDLLTREPWRSATPYTGVRIKGARIIKDPTKRSDPDLDLENAKLIRSVEILGSEILAKVDLKHAQTDSFISFNSSLIEGAFDGEGLRSATDLSLASSAIFEGPVTLLGAKVDGNVDLRDARFDDAVDATGIRVDGSLYMSSTGKDKTLFHAVNLDHARISGNWELRGTSLDVSFTRITQRFMDW